ncbi:MAG: acyl-CoA thioesterase [Bacteroidetes bacterium]|nr:acyl-CoA thioesterase [Bacteroidota bacterium]
MDNDIFKVDFKVRDYECDIQGIVNNSVYQNYLEHTRHEYLHHLGIDFAKYALEGINLIVIRAELDYKYPLRAGDEFYVDVKMERVSPIRFAFIQNIYRKSDDKLCVMGRIIGTALNANGRPKLPEEIEKIFDEAVK